MVDAALRAAGHRSARYTSPHLIDLRERFVIDGRPVEPETLNAAVTHVRDAVDTLRRDGVLQAQPTFFEVTTAVAFELFRQARVETAVLEVGLGGRLDATNVVVPVVSAITSIALEHQKYLGSTLPQIAIEKAGIIKSGVPVVVGEMDALALEAIEGVARERGAPIVRAWDDVSVTRVRRPDDGAVSVVGLRTPAHDYGDVTVGLRGAHQVGNAVVAVRVLEMLDGNGLSVPPEAVRAGLSRPEWPGRLDLRRLPD